MSPQRQRRISLPVFLLSLFPYVVSLSWTILGRYPPSDLRRLHRPYHQHPTSLGQDTKASVGSAFLGYKPIHTFQQTFSSGVVVCMHMGHSHSHHEHHHPTTSSTLSTAAAPRKQRERRRRRWATLIFGWIAIVGSRLVWQREMIRQVDLVACAMVTVGLLSLDTIRNEVVAFLRKLRNLRDGVAKHSPVPIAVGGTALSSFPVATTTTTSSSSLLHREADRVTIVGVVVNILLSAGKFLVGLHCHSSALIADAGHSLSDLFSDFVTLYTVQIARLPPDDDHPYGHGKFEAIGSLFLALTLIGTGIGVGAMANKELMQVISFSFQSSNTIPAGSVVAAVATPHLPRPPALAMAFLSIVSKEWLFRITKKVGQKINSPVVLANAWHHRSDAYSSILALISIGLAMWVPGFMVADSLAGLLVAGMICLTGADIMGESIKQLSDTTNEELVEKVRIMVKQSPDVTAVTRVRARQVGSSALVDVRVTTPSGLTTSVTRAVEERLRQLIMDNSPEVLDVEVHARPVGNIICPLLLKEQVKHEKELLWTNNTVSAYSQVESVVRQAALLHPQVETVEKVTVHVRDTTRLCVDVDVRLAGTDSLHDAQEYSRELKESLESTDWIDEAKIYLDMNQLDPPPITGVRDTNLLSGNKGSNSSGGERRGPGF